MEFLTGSSSSTSSSVRPPIAAINSDLAKVVKGKLLVISLHATVAMTHRGLLFYEFQASKFHDETRNDIGKLVLCYVQPPKQCSACTNMFTNSHKFPKTTNTLRRRSHSMSALKDGMPKKYGKTFSGSNIIIQWINSSLLADAQIYK